MLRSVLTTALVAAVLVAFLPHAFADDGAVAVADDLLVDREVEGDAVVLLGDLFLGPEAEVHGDAVAVLGRVHLEDGARVHGRIVGIRSLSSLDLDPLAPQAAGSTRFGLILLALGTWLFATTLLALAAPAWVCGGVRRVSELGWRILLLGLFAAATFIAALVAVLGLGPAFGVPLSGFLMLFFIGVKVVGLTVLGAWLGARLLGRWSRGSWPATLEVFVGVLVFLGLRLVPAAGGLLWNCLSVVALGAGAFTLIVQRTGGKAPIQAHPDPPGQPLP